MAGHSTAALSAATQRHSKAAEICRQVLFTDVCRAHGIQPVRGRIAAPWRKTTDRNVSVRDESNTWTDFVSGEKGGLLEFLVRVRGCSRADALRWLADFAGIPLEDHRFSPAERAEWAREMAEVKRSLPAARLWRRAALNMAEEWLHARKSALVDPTLPAPSVAEIMSLEGLVSGLRKLDGGALAAEYRKWQARYPVLVRGMVDWMAECDRAERRALLSFLQSASREATA